MVCLVVSHSWSSVESGNSSHGWSSGVGGDSWSVMVSRDVWSGVVGGHGTTHGGSSNSVTSQTRVAK
ncbi:unnamed protein product, partial [Ixodes pacificus]